MKRCIEKRQWSCALSQTLVIMKKQSRSFYILRTMWIGACGLTSRKARHLSSSCTISAGISFRMILPKIVSSCSLAGGAAPSSVRAICTEGDLENDRNACLRLIRKCCCTRCARPRFTEWIGWTSERCRNDRATRLGTKDARIAAKLLLRLRSFVHTMTMSARSGLIKPFDVTVAPSEMSDSGRDHEEKFMRIRTFPALSLANLVWLCFSLLSGWASQPCSAPFLKKDVELCACNTEASLPLRYKSHYCTGNKLQLTLLLFCLLSNLNHL